LAVNDSDRAAIEQMQRACDEFATAAKGMAASAATVNRNIDELGRALLAWIKLTEKQFAEISANIKRR
jgi:hypothetical protein